MELTYIEIEDILDMNYVASSSTRCTPPPGVYEIRDNNSMLKSFFPDEVKTKMTNEDIRLKSNLTINRTIRFTRKSFSIVCWDLLNQIWDHQVILTDSFN